MLIPPSPTIKAFLGWKSCLKFSSPAVFFSALLFTLIATNVYEDVPEILRFARDDNNGMTITGVSRSISFQTFLSIIRQNKSVFLAMTNYWLTFASTFNG